MERVNRAQRDRDRKESLLRQAEQAETAHQEASKTLKEAEGGMETLLQQARCREEQEIPQIIEKAEQLAGLRKDAAGLEEQLLSHGGGLSLEEIIEEAGGADGDALPSQLKETEAELAENRREQDELNRTFGATRSEYNEKIVGSSMEALEAEEEAQGVLAELGEKAGEYLRLAAIVLRRSIDRYREENQSPVIKAAGELFARLTGGSFSGLEVDFDEKDNPVLLGARPAKGEPL